MFSTRLIRHGDALLMLETFAFLIRRHGLPKRPDVPSPVRPQLGIDALRFDSARDCNVYDWARAALTRILQATDRPLDRLNLVASRDPYPRQPELLSFDPERAHEPGHFTARLVLELAEGLLDGFETPALLDDYRKAVVRLSACAYLRQGFTLARCLPATGEALAEYGVPQRFIENMLVGGACLGLALRRQTPEQVLATYGSVMTRSVRRKIRPACRQLDGFEPEVKLLRVLPRAAPDRSAAFARSVEPQPQRISWT